MAYVNSVHFSMTQMNVLHVLTYSFLFTITFTVSLTAAVPVFLFTSFLHQLLSSL